MAVGDIETYYTRADGKWRNKVEGIAHAPSVHETEAEAVERGRLLAIYRSQNLDHGTVEHIVRNMDGKIGYRDTYQRSRDPRRSRG